MQLRPRHYILIGLILLLGVYNVLRLRRARQAPANPIARHTPVITGPRLESPAWQAFDRAADLRDAPDAQFKPALAPLQKGSGNATPDPDLQGCVTWLEFYRQGVLHPSRDTQWRNRSTEHLVSCMRYHRDLSS